MKSSVVLLFLLYASSLNANAYVDTYTKNHSRDVQSVVENINEQKDQVNSNNLNFSLKKNNDTSSKKQGSSNYDNYNKGNFNDYDRNNYGR